MAEKRKSGHRGNKIRLILRQRAGMILYMCILKTVIFVYFSKRVCVFVSMCRISCSLKVKLELNSSDVKCK